MAKYIYIYGKMGSEWIEEFETLEAAKKHGDYDWNHQNDYDKKHCDYAYILESVNPDPDAPDHLDGNPVIIYKDYND